MTEYNVFVMGSCSVGKSTLINKFIPNVARVNDDYVGNQNIRRTTTDISYYSMPKNGTMNVTFIDSPGLFDQIIISYESCCEHLEHIFKEVKFIDYVIFCISASKHGIRKIDLESLKILHNFPTFLKDRTFIYITKTDLLDDVENANFRRHCYNNELINRYKIFNSDKIENNSSLMNMFTSKNPRNLCNIIEEQHKIPIIEKLQLEMISNNLYSNGYLKYEKPYINHKKNLLFTVCALQIIALIYLAFSNNFGLLGILLSFIVSGSVLIILYMAIDVSIMCGVSFLTHINQKYTFKYRKYGLDYEIQIKLCKINSVFHNNAPIEDTIFYASGECFFRGTLYGNSFNQGIFYNKDGSILYEKKL